MGGPLFIQIISLEIVVQIPFSNDNNAMMLV